MGYACPVCEDPQADDVHLANHLAFTAMTGGDDHEAWLDEHVPDWGQLGEAELSTEVVEYAEETEFPQVFEDTVDRSGDGHSHDHGTGHEHGHGDLPQGANRHRGSNALSDHDSEVLAEARDLTREMLRDSDDETDGDAADNGSESDTDDTSESDADDRADERGDETE